MNERPGEWRCFVAGLYGCLGHQQTGTVAINAEDVLW
jgi:hypothetical protein